MISKAENVENLPQKYKVIYSDLHNMKHLYKNELSSVQDS